jgi:hypothetical protein
LYQESGWSNNLSAFPSPFKEEGGGEGTDGGEDEETEKNESFEGSLEEKKCQALLEKV